MPTIRLQPKQRLAYDLLASSQYRHLGIYGGRGSAKSGGIDRIGLSLLIDQPGITACVVMRTYEQLRKYHIDPLLKAFPDIEPYYHRTDKKLVLPCAGGSSQLDLGYAENYDAVEQFFRSANYKYIFIDQAEQFIESELREMRKACRWPGGGAKLLYSFNMGGAGIQTLRKWFHTHEVGERENPALYESLRFNPWDNIEWVRDALAADGLTESDYYNLWTDEQRMEYSARRGEYTAELASEDDALRNRDWLGSWDSLEGAYYARVFDRASILLDRSQVSQLVQPWDVRWLSQDWGKQHYNVTYWHAVTQVSPERARRILGWDVDQPFKAVVTYRELVVNELSSQEVAEQIINATPESERKLVKSFFLSPDAFGERDSDNTTADNLGAGLRRAGLPAPEPADTSRADGWMLLYDLMQATKRHAATGGDCCLIGAECPVLLESIPLLMRDPKDLDVVLKTDKGAARLDQDSSECFVADTPILTPSGNVRIADLKIGDLVETSHGPRHVLNAWMARKNAPIVEALFSNGVRLRCTEDHLFMRTEGEYAPLNSLRYGDKLVAWSQSLTTGKSIGGLGNTTETSGSCTELSGKMYTGRSHADTVSTTSTGTAKTTTSRISSASRRSSTWQSIRNAAAVVLNTWLRFDLWLWRGMVRMKAALGLGRTPPQLDWVTSQMCLSSATTAGSPSWGGLSQSSAPMPTSPHGGASQGWTTSNAPAKPADASSQSTDTNALGLALGSVVRFLGFVPAGFADVYDIETEEVHQFYAGGILVHNSWRYGLKSFLSPRKVAPLAVRAQEVYSSISDPHNRGMAMAQFYQKNKPHASKPNWRQSATL